MSTEATTVTRTQEWRGKVPPNKNLKTHHGILMVFFFLIPSIPAVLGNFLIPLMIGAKDLAFPRLNLLSWYIYMIGGAFTLYALVTGGVDTGWTMFAPVGTKFV